MKPLGAFGPGGDLLKLHVGAIGPTRKKISLEIPTIFFVQISHCFLPQKIDGIFPTTVVIWMELCSFYFTF